MRTRASVLSTICLLIPLAAACDRSIRRDRAAVDSAQADQNKKSSLVLAGQLRTVNTNRETLIVAFGDDLYEFAYTDDTEVVGAATGVQGLTGSRGDEVTVHYRQNPITSTKTAERIELQ